MTSGSYRIIGSSPMLEGVLKTVSKVAPTESTVLVTGESGTGKELIVKELHYNSPRADQPFVPINCGAIPKDLLESELFGHEKGAFTHAVRSRMGRFEMAHGGTVLLDEIGELDQPLQVKILRVIQEKEIERVGGNQAKNVDVRIIAASNRNLEHEVEQGRFREDLYYRLNVVPVHLPPLRERKEDIMTLAKHFLSSYCQKKQRNILEISPQAEKMLKNYSWPGNVRELENFMERMSILCEGDSVQSEDLPDKILSENSSCSSTTPDREPAAQNSGNFWPSLEQLRAYNTNLKDMMEQFEASLIQEALSESDGVKNKAAEKLGIKRTTLIEKLKKFNNS